MGPRLFSRGNIALGYAMDGPHKGLQWGHDFSAVEIFDGNFIGGVRAWLQWGHDFSAVEIKRGSRQEPDQEISFNGATTFQPWKSGIELAIRQYYIQASMGPRLFSRGNSILVQILWKVGIIELQWGHDFSAVEMGCITRWGSNERDTASMGPRLFSRGNVARVRYREYPLTGQLQWGHDFSAVEIQIPVKGSPMISELQWGHDFSAVEIVVVFPSYFKSIRLASMGPRLFSRGNARCRKNPYPTIYRFNGATTFQPWKWLGVVARTVGEARFNGATTFQPWKYYHLLKCIGCILMLQWGHDFSAVEMVFMVFSLAKMECFNGATTFQPWKYRMKEILTHAGIPHASMGPRLFSRGNIVTIHPNDTYTIRLQWGHDFSAVEI